MAACTVIIPVHNQLGYTRRCLESLLQHTDVPFRLVVIDNGSTDGTGAFLAALSRSLPPGGRGRLTDLAVIGNPHNRGVAPAWNQGIGAAEPGRPVCLLNNDVVVTPGWLGAVLGFLDEHPESGIAGPHVTDGDMPGGYEEWARRYVAANANRTDEGFHGCCFVLTPAVLERVGLFDERFEIAVWEDVDYCHRARLAGFAPRVTHRAVVHHFGNRTIGLVAASLGGRNLYAENLRRFTEKWGLQLGRFTVSRSMLITR